MEVEFRQLVASADNHCFSLEAPQQTTQRSLNFEDHVRAHRRHRADIPDRLDRVAETLFGVEKDEFTRYVLPGPFRPFEFPFHPWLSLSAPFVFAPAGIERAEPQ